MGTFQFPIIFPEVEEEDGGSLGLCMICMDEFVVGSKARKAPSCSHVYHEGCIRKWLARDNSCPLCRSRILAKE
ncbi:hypothetical protein AMTRI_Chr05g58100 [Amborella trichopoda]